ncbi:zinc-ribbon domain-containing protein [Leifsonia sp. P73]|uniref:zinc ribbon domain-containing protein n=1 Tax=Leifsonia sp. P73 TaxID=3423959 RepID=UPI003DA4330C
MTCRVCGAELKDGTLFCGNCGSSVTATRVRPPEMADSRPSDTSIVPPLAKPPVGRSKPAVAGRFPGDVELDEDGLPPTEAIDIVSLDSAPPAPSAARVRVYRLSFSTGSRWRCAAAASSGAAPSRSRGARRPARRHLRPGQERVQDPPGVRPGG